MLYRAADTPYMIFTTDVRLVITYEPQLTAPNTPGGFSIGTVTTYSAYLSWNSVSTADRYRYTNQQLNPTGSTNDFTTTGTSITNSSGISSNNRYRWRVRAENDAGDSDYTSYIYRTTLPLTPSSVSASPASGTTGETSIDVFWNHIAGTELDRYRVQREGGTTSGATTSSNSHNSTGLNPNTTYRYRVRSENAEGNSSYSGWASATTKLPAPAVPNQPSASNLTKTSVTISWDAVAYAASYDLRQDGAVVLSSVQGTSHDITGLADNSSFNFDVRAKNATGTSGYSTDRVVETAPIHVAPPTPTNVGPAGVQTPGVITFTADALAMDQAKNYDLQQRIWWEMFSVPFEESKSKVYISSYGEPGTRTFAVDMTDEGLLGNYTLSAYSQHDGDEDRTSPVTASLDLTFTRTKVSIGGVWIPKRVFVFDSAAWVEKFPQARIDGAWK
ncbi:MAG: fibronectin type III domain-containing protein [Dermatophilaceae bacterium]